MDSSPPIPQLPEVKEVKKKTPVSEKQWLQLVKVKRENGETLDVPYDAISNRNAAKILSAKTRIFIENQLDLAKNKELSTKEVRDLTEAASNVAEMSYKAYEGIEADLTKPSNTATGAALTAYAVAKGMADGLAGGDGMDKLFAKLDSVGRSRTDKAKIIDITPEKVC